MKKLGFWKTDIAGLPCFEYTGRVPFSATLKNGEKVKLPDDPFFLLGNYRITLFTHISGKYELISGQRSWARINHGSDSNYSKIKINGKGFLLAGQHSVATNPSLCKRIFGCGYAMYDYSLENISVTRMLSVKPSTTAYNGSSAFKLSICVKNNSSDKAEISFSEGIYAHFKEIQYQHIPDEEHRVKYFYILGENKKDKLVCIEIKGNCSDPLLCGERGDMSRFDGFPPTLFMKAVSQGITLWGNNRELSADMSFSLEGGEQREFQLIIGFAFGDGVSTIENICEEMQSGNLPYSQEWNRIIPSLDSENDADLRREMRWHAYNLEAMATYSEYYGETKIPQGTIYDYTWGAHASARDNFQHALPLVYYNPALAKSTLRYMLKRTTPFGEIRLIECGNGYADNERYFTSDQQLYYFLLLSEYLRITGDCDFLNEKITPYPAKNQSEMTVLEMTEKCFIFLRDTVGIGSHGLVRLLNSDWNDAVYYIEKVPHNNIFFTGESHMNSAMAISILQNLIPQLKKIR